MTDQKVLRHVVLFKFKDHTSKKKITEVKDTFVALKGKIPVIRDFEWGTNVGIEGIYQGFTHCFFLTFRSEEDRITYLPHHNHKVLVKLLSPHLDKVRVVDYWAKH